jgi:hypothetical protein
MLAVTVVNDPISTDIAEIRELVALYAREVREKQNARDESALREAARVARYKSEDAQQARKPRTRKSTSKAARKPRTS